MDHNSFAKEIKARLSEAEALTEHFSANQIRLTSLLNIGSKSLEPLAYSIVGHGFDVNHIKALDSKSLGYIKAFIDDSDLSSKELAFYNGVTADSFELDNEDIDVLTSTPAVVESKVVFEVKVGDQDLTDDLKDKMEELFGAKYDMYQALLKVEDCGSEGTGGDDGACDFGMYLLGAGVTVCEIDTFGSETKSKMIDLLVKYLKADAQFEGLKALLEGIKSVC